MTLHLGKLLEMIQTQANVVSTQMASLAAAGTAIQVAAMIRLQLAMNKFSQISDLGSTTVSVFNNAFKNMISNIQR